MRPQIIDRSRDQDFMRLALALAAEGAAWAKCRWARCWCSTGSHRPGFNCPISDSDPSAHAEMVAIRAAAQAASNYRLPGSTLYVTLEPCSMCAGLIVHSRVARVVYGALEPKAGIVQSQGQFFGQGFLNHRVLVEGGVLAEECGPERVLQGPTGENLSPERLGWLPASPLPQVQRKLQKPGGF
jgi:tRNA(Arg) A34 adenosine deaminase TadA